jgi:hypothetical protein
MDTFVELSPGEAAELAPALETFSRGARWPITLDYLYQRWSDFVRQVERGYDASIYDYTNDLSVRDIFEDILRQVGGSTREKLITALQPWDARFDQATTEAARALLISKTATGGPWWRRIPLKLLAELEADLRSEGLVE